MSDDRGTDEPASFLAQRGDGLLRFTADLRAHPTLTRRPTTVPLD